MSLQGNGGVIEIIAGSYKGKTGGSSTFSPIHLLNAKLKKGYSAEFSFPADFTTSLLVVEGSISVNGSVIPEDNFAFFNRDGNAFTVEAKEDSIVLVMSGEPIREPIASHGPFVMNTKQELLAAFDEFNSGKFGYLED